MTWLDYVGVFAAVWLVLEIVHLALRHRAAARPDWMDEGNRRVR